MMGLRVLFWNNSSLLITEEILAVGNLGLISERWGSLWFMMEEFLLKIKYLQLEFRLPGVIFQLVINIGSLIF